MKGETDLSDEMSLPWLQSGDRLFIEGDDWYHNALLHFLVDKADELDLYIAGYKEGGDRLVRSIMEDRTHQDVLVYPTVFLYRQYLELNLKRLIREGNQLLENPSRWGEVGFPTDRQSHNLSRLWNEECIALVQTMGAEYEDMQISAQDLTAIGDLLEQFVEQDPYSYGFRYPTDSRNRPSFPDLHVINVRNLAEIMAKLAVFFDGAATAISVHWDFKREMRRYLDQEMGHGESHEEETSDFN